MSYFSTSTTKILLTDSYCLSENFSDGSGESDSGIWFLDKGDTGVECAAGFGGAGAVTGGK